MGMRMCVFVYLSILASLFALLQIVNSGTTTQGLAWLAAKETEPGVIKRPSGLLYKVLKSGPEGAASPKADTRCKCHYRGTLMDGTEFDSSYKRGKPATFAPNQVIPGWTEAMQLMKEGDKWELFIPAELAYGDSQRGRFITPGSVLVFELEIIEVMSDNKPEL
eukprot:g53442.t1